MIYVKIHREHRKVLRRTTRAGLGLFLSFLLLYPVRAQSAGAYQVNWIGEYPDRQGDTKPSFGERISRIVFGQKAEEVVKPFNVVAAAIDNFWILDQGAGGLFHISDGQGALVRSQKRGEQDFPSLVGLCRMSGGDLLFTDSRLNRVLLIHEDLIMSFADSVALDQPTGIACNRVNGDIWVVETGAHRILHLNSQGQEIARIGERGTAPGQFNFPTFIWIDREGRLYIVDSMNYRIQMLDQEGACLGSFGESGDATGYMARPKGIATDSKGHIYVADALFHAVQIFDRQGNFLYSFGSQGQGRGEFWMPAGLYIDEQDHIYVADSYNGRVQIFQLEKNK